MRNINVHSLDKLIKKVLFVTDNYSYCIHSPRAAFEFERHPVPFGNARRGVGDVKKVFLGTGGILDEAVAFGCGEIFHPAAHRLLLLDFRLSRDRNFDLRGVDLLLGLHILRGRVKDAVFVDIRQHVLETAAPAAQTLLLFLLLVLTFGLL